MLIPVILAGGAGTRLWPLSRQNCPKPFADLGLPEKLFNTAVARAQEVADCAPWVVCTKQQQSLVSSNAPSAKIILEPAARGTNSAIMLAAKAAVAQHKDAVLLILSADHYIPDVTAFSQTVEDAVKLTDEHIVTFGIKPTSAHTGYGYIIPGKNNKIERFTEKPDSTKAAELIKAGALWNSGMFLARASLLLEECANFVPECLDNIGDLITTGNITTTEKYSGCPNISFDYAIMERSSRAAVIAFKGDWDDIGAFDSLHNYLERDDNGTALSGDAVQLDCKDTAVISQHRLVCAVGLENTIVVETPDVVLVINKNHAQQVKPLLNKLGARREVAEYPGESRPWGKFLTIEEGPRYRVKRIEVNPGGRLSTQMHHHRAEHWIVVKGTALVTRGEDTFMLTENESTYIPVGTVHRLENQGKIPLELIEVQSGAYLGEDDIVRLDDVYGRAKTPETN